MNFIDSIRRGAARRARYRQTLHELRSMPVNVAIDLDIDRSNARTIARQAVYGI